MNIFLCCYILLHSISSNAWATVLGLAEQINDIKVLTRILWFSGPFPLSRELGKGHISSRCKVLLW